MPVGRLPVSFCACPLFFLSVPAPTKFPDLLLPLLMSHASGLYVIFCACLVHAASHDHSLQAMFSTLLIFLRVLAHVDCQVLDQKQTSSTFPRSVHRGFATHVFEAQACPDAFLEIFAHTVSYCERFFAKACILDIPGSARKLFSRWALGEFAVFLGDVATSGKPQFNMPAASFRVDKFCPGT